MTSNSTAIHSYDIQYSTVSIPTSSSKRIRRSLLSCITPWNHDNLTSLMYQHFMRPLKFVYWHISSMHWAACQPECSPFQRLQNLTHHIKKKLASGTFTVIQMKEKLPPARYYIPLICSLEMLCVLACYFKVFSPSCFEVIQFVLHELFFFFLCEFGLIKRAQEIQWKVPTRNCGISSTYFTSLHHCWWKLSQGRQDIFLAN